MRTTLTLLLTTLLLTTTAPSFLSVLAAPVTLPDVLVPKGATLNARSIPDLLVLKRANEKRALDVNGGEMLEGGWRRG